MPKRFKFKIFINCLSRSIWLSHPYDRLNSIYTLCQKWQSPFFRNPFSVDVVFYRVVLLYFEGKYAFIFKNKGFIKIIVYRKSKRISDESHVLKPFHGFVGARVHSSPGSHYYIVNNSIVENLLDIYWPISVIFRF